MASLTELRYVVAVARELHFGRAAARCFVSQPTLSVGVKRLEESLGVQIFERASRSEVQVTPEGRAIIEQAERVLGEMERLEDLAHTRRDPLAAPLRVGLIHTVGPYLLPHLIGRLHELAPRMPIEITEGMTADLAEQLEHGELDVVVLSLPFEAPGVTVEPVYREPFTVAVPADHPLAEQDAVEPDQLAEHDLLLLGRGHCFRDQVLGVCPRCNDGRTFGRLQRTLEGGSLETMRMMVASGAGITVLPCASTENSEATGTRTLVRYLPFGRDIPARDIALASRRRFSRPQAVAVLARSIRETLPACCQPLPAGEPVSRG
ncbi:MULTISPECIES: LysR substrate-binding domain-containing protein [unclassified Guyparkeria]|uniref:LysR substrate-binding domain-containing protein n=1 Tax=unclassified Guyparkeria TaxID=2626246 RepID=UPI00073382C8|nr:MULTISPECIES: LysR substrate-binding domain-containing protein [unclassified Guyparkeria]KTG16671.1 LysR family transcriptional regulator [Guyparkeria sp. XI15]OAE85705.1 LysR family transcriptional regulator [Guyparkeria sp. WRN-7]